MFLEISSCEPNPCEHGLCFDKQTYICYCVNKNYEETDYQGVNCSERKLHNYIEIKNYLSFIQNVEMVFALT